MVFAMLGQTESSGECEPAPSSGRSRHSPRIHLSAIAFVCYRASARRFVCSLSGDDFQSARRRHRSMRALLRWPRLSSSLPLFSGTYRALSLAITTFALRNEERVLRIKFGAAFETYCSRTPRWIFI